MPTLKLLFRRTLATTPAATPLPSILSPPRRLTIHGGSRGGGRRSTLTNGVGPRLGSVGGAHVNKNILVSNKTTNNSVLYILSPKFSSSSSSSSSFFEERENSARNLIRVSSTQFFGGEMGGENRKRNGVVVDCVQHQNGVVSNSNSNFNFNSSSMKKDDDHQSHEECTKLITLPTVLTLARVAAIPLFIATFYVNSSWGTTATTSIFVAAAITDWLDGYLARKMRLGTVFGAFLDPVADKLMVAATLVLLCSRPPETAFFGDVPWLFPVPAIAIIGREITMSAVREWAASQNTELLQAVAVNNLGKWKTATQMTALTILVATRDSRLAGSETLATSGVALLYISAGLAVWSLVVYMRKIWKVLLR
ncbi:hypothetical protein RND81_08G177800 [Saponaria officinalis]|uniref:CDP-diacylglycerol--glycerol-3-phosphate 1-phosphatidyltransferase n=1 Tax=Saponaria officinalis TaxID=3572 RepID=A0AAW1J829_SAPOF